MKIMTPPFVRPMPALSNGLAAPKRAAAPCPNFRAAWRNTKHIEE